MGPVLPDLCVIMRRPHQLHGWLSKHSAGPQAQVGPSALFRLVDHTGMARFQPRKLQGCASMQGLPWPDCTLSHHACLRPPAPMPTWARGRGAKVGLGDRLVTQSIAIASVRCRQRSSPHVACATRGWDRRRMRTCEAPGGEQGFRPCRNRRSLPRTPAGAARGLTVFTSLACSPCATRLRVSAVTRLGGACRPRTTQCHLPGHL